MSGGVHRSTGRGRSGARWNGEMGRAAVSESLRATIAQLHAEEAQVASIIDALAARRQTLEEQVQSVYDRVQPILVDLDRERVELVEKLQRMSAVTGEAGDAMRSLDAVQTRVNLVISRIDDLLEIRRCIDGVRTAMKAERYEEATQHLEKYLAFVSRSPEAAEATAVMRGAQEDLQKLVKERLDTAVLRKQPEEVNKYVRLVAPLGLRAHSLRKYSEHVCELAAGMDTDTTPHPNYLKKLTTIFEAVAGVYEERQALLHDVFGPEGCLYVLRALRRLSDQHAAALLPSFIEDRQIERKLKALRSAASVAVQAGALAERLARDQRTRLPPPPEALLSPPRIDARDLDVLLEEVSLVLHRFELFHSFLKAEAAACEEDVQRERKGHIKGTAADNGAEDVEEITVALVFRGWRLLEEAQRLAGLYTVIESFFMRESTKKAISLDEPIERDGGVVESSLVDDIFFIFQKCNYRAVFCLSEACVCAVINHSNAVLLDYLKEVFQKQTNTIGSEQPSAHAKTINNIARSLAHIPRLRSQVETAVRRTMMDGGGSMEGSMEGSMDGALPPSITACLEEVGNTSYALKQMLEIALEQLHRALSERLTAVLDTFSALGYVLVESDYLAAETSEFCVKLFAEIEQLYEPYRKMLMESNFGHLLRHLVGFVVQRVEKLALQKRFNQLGGLQFDRDVRVMISYFSQLAQSSVREQFLRLSQICQILILQSPAEVLDYYTPGVTWRLSPADIRAVLRLRVDFKATTISKLQL